MSIYEEIAHVLSDENGTDYDQELADTKSFARMEAAMDLEIRKAAKIALNMKGFVPVEMEDFRGY